MPFDINKFNNKSTYFKQPAKGVHKYTLALDNQGLWRVVVLNYDRETDTFEAVQAVLESALQHLRGAFQ